MFYFSSKPFKTVECNKCNSIIVYEKKDINIDENNHEYIECPCCKSSVSINKEDTDKEEIKEDKDLPDVLFYGMQTLNYISEANYYPWTDEFSLLYIKKCFDKLNEKLDEVYDMEKIFSGETDVNTLSNFGFVKYSDNKDEEGRVLYLIPLYLLPLMPKGTKVRSLFGKIIEYDGTNISEDTRGGLLAYGILVKED